MGALDGWAYSNTLYFLGCHRWTGVLFEASPHNYRALVRNRPTDANVLMAACDSDGDVVDFLDRGGGIAGLATSTWATEERNTGHTPLRPVYCGRLSDALARLGLTHIDLVSLGEPWGSAVIALAVCTMYMQYARPDAPPWLRRPTARVCTTLHADVEGAELQCLKTLLRPSQAGGLEGAGVEAGPTRGTPPPPVHVDVLLIEIGALGKDGTEGVRRARRGVEALLSASGYRSVHTLSGSVVFVRKGSAAEEAALERNASMSRLSDAGGTKHDGASSDRASDVPSPNRAKAKFHRNNQRLPPRGQNLPADLPLGWEPGPGQKGLGHRNRRGQGGPRSRASGLHIQ